MKRVLLQDRQRFFSTTRFNLFDSPRQEKYVRLSARTYFDPRAVQSGSNAKKKKKKFKASQEAQAAVTCYLTGKAVNIRHSELPLLV